MDNFHERRAALIAPAQDQLIVVKFLHAMSGLYIWEYFTTLDYEWRVIRGRLPYRWTIWIYSAARLAGLVSVILGFVNMDVTTQINCQLWSLFSVLFLCLAAIMASLLIVLRTIAICNRNKVVVMLTFIVWGTSIGFHLHNIALVRSAWDPTQLTCGSVQRDSNAIDVIGVIIADTVLLLIILAGLLVMRGHDRGAFGLSRLLWKQGIIWLVLGFAVEAPQLVFTSLHLNDWLHDLFADSSQIIIIIVATRMHRSLVNFASGSSNAAYESPPVSNLTSFKIKQTSTPSTALDRVEMAIHTNTERHPTSSTRDDISSTIVSTNEQMGK
ncbi:hypothetical protein BGY98DRAFT_438463 [Russula aff. rugulosa BPL654]|nr:hypothetical protein BGY98DRAFT_438463 [Russula aff. rugulosa BPL654]